MMSAEGEITDEGTLVFKERMTLFKDNQLEELFRRKEIRNQQYKERKLFDHEKRLQKGKIWEPQKLCPMK